MNRPDLSERSRALVLLGILAAAVLAALFAGPIAQDPAYHGFADARTLAGIPNALDVLSNLPFTLVGIWGLRYVIRAGHAPDRYCKTGIERVGWGVLCFGVALIGLGSAWYHWAPDSERLVWDRLPMAIVFSALFAVIVYERISRRWGIRIFAPLVLAGAGSVLYWAAVDDLRPYAVFQFYPMVTIPLILWMYPPAYDRGADLIVVVGWYALAKVFEAADAAILDATGLFSGHTLKHLFAAVATAWIVRMLTKRRPVVGESAIV